MVSLLIPLYQKLSTD